MLKTARNDKKTVSNRGLGQRACGPHRTKSTKSGQQAGHFQPASRPMSPALSTPFLTYFSPFHNILPHFISILHILFSSNNFSFNFFSNFQIATSFINLLICSKSYFHRLCLAYGPLTPQFEMVFCQMTCLAYGPLSPSVGDDIKYGLTLFIKIQFLAGLYG